MRFPVIVNVDGRGALSVTYNPDRKGYKVVHLSRDEKNTLTTSYSSNIGAISNHYEVSCEGNFVNDGKRWVESGKPRLVEKRQG
jgi:hypothetical protein